MHFYPWWILGFFYFIWNQELALKGVLLYEIYGRQNAEDLPVAFMFWVCLLITPGIWVKSVCCLALCWHYGFSGNHQWLFKLEHCDLESFKIMDAQWSKTTYKIHWENFQRLWIYCNWIYWPRESNHFMCSAKSTFRIDGVDGSVALWLKRTGMGCIPWHLHCICLLVHIWLPTQWV